MVFLSAMNAPLGDPKMLKHVLETLDGLSEEMKSHYKEVNGKYYLQAEEPTQLKSALEKERAEKAAVIAKLKDFDADEYKKLKEAAALREAEDAKRRGDYEALEKQLKENHAKELKALEAELKAIRNERETSFINAEITSAIASAKGIPDLLMPVIRSKVKTEDKDGKLNIVVLGQDGKPRIKDGQGAAFTLADLVAELKSNETFGRAFDGAGATGAGTTPPPGGINNTSNAKARYDALMAKKDLTQSETYEAVNLAVQIQTDTLANKT